MKYFKFLIGVRNFDVRGNEIEHRVTRTVRANHLQGAIRQLYQSEDDMTRVIKILRG